jgi:hypothetical protein
MNDVTSKKTAPLSEADQWKKERVSFEKRGDGTPAIVLAPDAFADFGGSTSLLMTFINQVCNSSGANLAVEGQQELWKQAALSALMGINPKTDLEGMLATQLVACHMAALDCFRRAMSKNQPAKFRDYNLNQANKLCRTYATLLEALERCQGKSRQQKVTVEHVHVYPGGQAIVGHVEQKREGRDAKKEGSTPCS